jgi:DNA-binding HxlR family transcriptional regulator
MKRTTLADHPCSIARTLDVAGEWWTPLILRDIAYGIRRFGEIQEDLGISANVLADRLDTLVAEGILTRSAYQQRPERHEYSLTEKGSDLIPALLALMQWGDRWSWPGGRGPVRVQHEQCGHDVHVEVRCPHCEREATSGELRAKARGGVVEAPGQHQPGAVSGRRLLGSAEGVSIGARPGAADA